MTIEILAFQPDTQMTHIHDLWHRSLPGRWRVELPELKSVMMAAYASGDHFVALSGDTLVGFAATQTRSVAGESHPRGELMTLFVDPDYRRQGVGRTLLARSLDRLASRGVERVQLGGGGQTYFWPGVPTSNGGAWAFFQSCGWGEAERSYDLVGVLPEYETPNLVSDRIHQIGIAVEMAGPNDGEGLKELVRTHFPAWAEGYVERVDGGTVEDVVVARTGEGVVIGMSSANMPSDQKPGCPWADLKEDTGVIGALGVHPDWREKGIGLALAAKVSENLRDRGANRCFVGWTWLVEWYGRLGYDVWEEYVMSWMDIDDV